MTRRIFIGDIQGCREELERLLDELRFDPATDELYPVGDLVNRGPDSLGVLRLLYELDARAVLGNHDLHLLRTSQGERELSPGDTLAPVLAADDCDELCTWLANQPFARALPDLYVVHAGLHPQWDDPVAVLAGVDPFEPDPRSDFATRVRLCDAQGERPPHGAGGAEDPRYRPWFDFYDAGRHGGRRVVFGHWAVRGLVVEPHVRGLDTGCVWGGKLTAWIPEGERWVQVPAARAYAPIGS